MYNKKQVIYNFENYTYLLLYLLFSMNFYINNLKSTIYILHYNKIFHK
jgi:hypothetical protein